MRRVALLVAVAAVVPLGMAAAQPKPKLTLIGDSVADKMERNAVALASLNDGFRLNLQTRGCRNLVTPSCTIAGADGPPPTTLAIVKRFGRWIGKFVVVDVGYNDVPARYGRDLDTVMRALQSAHVQTVVWVTLRDPQHAFQDANKSIHLATKRWPHLVVADWDRYSDGHSDWFVGDGFHPTDLGAAELGRFIHSVLEATQRHN